MFSNCKKIVFPSVLTFEKHSDKLIMCQHKDLTSLRYVNSPETMFTYLHLKTWMMFSMLLSYQEWMRHSSGLWFNKRVTVLLPGNCSVWLRKTLRIRNGLTNNFLFSHTESYVRWHFQTIDPMTPHQNASAMLNGWVNSVTWYQRLDELNYLILAAYNRG